jgi:hypothetical protein
VLRGIRVTANIIPADETDFKDYLIWGIKMTVTLIPLPENPLPGSFASFNERWVIRIGTPSRLRFIFSTYPAFPILGKDGR